MTPVPKRGSKPRLAAQTAAASITPAMGAGAERPRRRGPILGIVVLGALLGVATVGAGTDGVTAAQSGPGAPFTFNFVGNPTSPQPWTPSNWDVAVESRNPGTFEHLLPMQAQHGADCSPYPATHYNDTYEGAVFLCRNHVMTAVNAGGYGEAVLTPDHMVDFSGGEATVRFNLSSLRTSYRDWAAFWITPFDDNLVLPIDPGQTVDLQGPPARGIEVRMDQGGGGTIFRATQIDNFKSTPLRVNTSKSLEKLVGVASATVRTTFELTISRTHLRFGVPSLGYYWIDSPITSLGWSRALVQLSHHSYNPTKDCAAQRLPVCLPNTWHWSDFYISNSVPFTMLRGDVQVVHAGTPALVKFPARAPQSSFLRFAAIGSIEFSLNGGKTWQPAHRQAQIYNVYDHFASYWTAVPAGTQSVTVRGQNWKGGPWWVRDVAIWSTTLPRPIQQPPTSQPKPAAPAAVAAQATFLQGLLNAADRHPLDAAAIAVLGAAVLVAAGYLVVLRRRRARLRSK
jgi:hypothetical protein